MAFRLQTSRFTYKTCVSFTNIKFSFYKLAFCFTNWRFVLQVSIKIINSGDNASAVIHSVKHEKNNVKFILQNAKINILSQVAEGDFNLCSFPGYDILSLS